MIMINPPYAWKLNTYEDFIEHSAYLDKRMSTTTYIVNLTLKEINDNFFKRDIQYLLGKEIEKPFQDKTGKVAKSTIYSNDPDQTGRRLEKINSFHVLYNSIKDNGVKHPLSINYFKSGKFGTHPGNTRLFFGDFYKEKIYSVLTDYKGTVKQDFPNIIFYNTNEVSFDVSDLSLILHDAKQSMPGSIIGPAEETDFEYKEITEVPDAVLGDPTKYEIIKTYQLKKNNTVLVVNDQMILQKTNNIWEFCQ